MDSAAERTRRYRRHREGLHDLCRPDRCKEAQGTEAGPPPVTRTRVGDYEAQRLQEQLRQAEAEIAGLRRVCVGVEPALTVRVEDVPGLLGWWESERSRLTSRLAELLGDNSEVTG